MSKNVFTFALLAAMFGSVLMLDFCKEFVQSGTNPVFIRTTNKHKFYVSIGDKYWNINVITPKNKDSIEGMALTMKSNDSLESRVLKNFDDNLMAFVVSLGNQNRFVVIDKERTQLAWSQTIDSNSFADFKPGGNQSIDWFKGNESLGMTDVSNGSYDKSKRLIFLQTKSNGTIWTVVPKYYELNADFSGHEKGKMSEDWDKKLRALKTNYAMIGVFFSWFDQFYKKYGIGLMMFFRDNKTIKWCWLSEKKDVEECKNPKKELIDCSKTPDPPTTTVSTTPLPESDDFPLVWILVAIGILVVIIIAIVVFIFCFLLTSKEDNENTTYNPSAVSTIETNRSSLKPKTSSAKLKTSESTNPKPFKF